VERGGKKNWGRKSGVQPSKHDDNSSEISKGLWRTSVWVGVVRGEMNAPTLVRRELIFRVRVCYLMKRTSNAGRLRANLRRSAYSKA